MVDLWPQKISNVKVTSPVAILREQASLLGQKTKNIVQASVSKFGKPSDEEFYYAFYIVAPAIGNYHYRLFSVSHDIRLYPLKIYVDDDIAEELNIHDEEQVRSYLLATSEEEFLEKLKQVFAAKKTTQVITALLSQTEPLWEPEENADTDDIPF